MNFTEYALKNKALVYFFVFVLVVGGIYSFFTMSKLEDPAITVKQAMVVTTFPGASAWQVELEVTDVLEKSIRSMGDLDHVESRSMDDISLILVELSSTVPLAELQQNWDILRRKVANVQAQLPAGAQPSTVMDDFGDVYGMFYAMTSDGFDYQKMMDYAQLVRRTVLDIDGVSSVDIYGERPACIDIDIQESKMANLGVHPAEIILTLRGQNATVYSGYYNSGEKRVRVGIDGDFNGIEDIRNLLIRGHEEDDIRLGDVADITKGYVQPQQEGLKYDTLPAIAISIAMQKGGNIIQLGKVIDQKLDELKQNIIPAGINFEKVFFQPTRVKDAISVFMVNLIESVLIVIIVVMLAMGFRSGYIIGIGLVVVVLGSFVILHMMHGTLQRVSLASFIVAMGMLVDNAIVVMENIFRNMDENNLPPAEAAVRGTSEVAGAITASTLTTIVVFLPIVYLQGAAGELFKEQAWTVSFSLLSSLFVSILFIPMLASKFMRKKDNISSHAITIKGFGNFVGKVLKRKYLVIGVATILMIVSYLMLPLIGMEFMPKTESKEFSILVTMEPGTRLKSTDNAVGTIEDAIRTLGQDDIEWQYTLVGPSNLESQSGGKLESENQSQIKVKIKKDSKLDADYFITNINENYPLPEGVEISYEKGESALQSILGTEGAPLVIEVKGEELELLDELCTEIKEKIIGIPGIYDIKSSLEKGAPEVNIKIDRLKSGIYGIDVATVSNQVSEKLAGKDAGTFETQGETIDINIKVPEVTLSEIYDIEIVQGEKKYRLGEIADIEITSAPKEINRVNQSRTGIVTAMLEKQYSLNHVTPAIKAKLSEVEFPAKYSAKITGEEEMRQESFSGLGFALFLSILLVYMVMAAQFESLRHPFTILLTIPLAGVGCILAFLLTGQTLNMMAFIGIIMLAGIAVNSSIILVDAINRLKEEGHPLEEAIQMAAQHRVRPIIMTSATTILALLPMCFGFGEGASLRSPMALAVIGGLLTSTIMTLIVIPCVYYVIDRKKS